MQPKLLTVFSHNHNYQQTYKILKIKTLSYHQKNSHSEIDFWGGKRKANLFQDFELIDTSKFIRSSPKKSIISDLSDKQSFCMINEDNSICQLQKSQVQINSESNIDNNQIPSLFKTRMFRPLSEQKKKKMRNIFFDDNNSIEQDSYSVFLNQSAISPKQRFRKKGKVDNEWNKHFEEFNVYQNGVVVSQIRRYIGQKNPLLMRQEKFYKRAVKTFWNPTKYPNKVEYPILKSIKNQLSQQFRYGQGEFDSYIEIYPKPYYNQLFLNKNQELVDIITSMTKFIINNKGMILTGAFQLQNLYKLKEKQFLLKDLGSSAIVEKIKIRDKNIVYLYPPYFKDQDQKGKWLIRPEYLAPQVLNSLTNFDFQWISQNPQAVIAAQIWSLGCMLLQMLTLIPLNSDIRCRVKSHPQNLRRGFLSIKFKQNFIDFQTLQKKQKGLQIIMNKTLESQLKNVSVQNKILTILKKMLIYESQKRIKPQQILSYLKS